MNVFILQKSYLPSKKFQITDVDTGKTIHFGAKGYSDYTIHKDVERKNRYIARHKPRENFNDLNTAGAWAKWISWSHPTINESIKAMERHFGIKIINMI